MTIWPGLRPLTIIEHVKPYLLKMHFTTLHVHAKVFHPLTDKVAVAASSNEKSLRTIMGISSNVDGAAKIGKILGERLLFRNILAVKVFLESEQEYDDMVKAVVDNVRDAGVKIL